MEFFFLQIIWLQLDWESNAKMHVPLNRMPKLSIVWPLMYKKIPIRKMKLKKFYSWKTAKNYLSRLRIAKLTPTWANHNSLGILSNGMHLPKKTVSSVKFICKGWKESKTQSKTQTYRHLQLILQKQKYLRALSQHPEMVITMSASSTAQTIFKLLKKFSSAFHR